MKGNVLCIITKYKLLCIFVVILYKGEYSSDRETSVKAKYKCDGLEP